LSTARCDKTSPLVPPERGVQAAPAHIDSAGVSRGKVETVERLWKLPVGVKADAQPARGRVCRARPVRRFVPHSSQE